MTTQVVLLRAINVGGRGKLPMADLRRCLGNAGCEDVRTVLQSGNAVVRVSGKGGPTLERQVEAALADQFGLRSDAIVRSASEWRDLIAGNPFADMAADDPSHLVALVAKRVPTAAGIDQLRAAVAKVGGRDEVGVGGAQVYMTYPDGIGDSKVTAAVIERALGTPVTGRNWNTVLKVAAMLT